MRYTEKHFYLMCKHIENNFYMFKTRNGKYHVVIDHPYYSKLHARYFITGFDREHAEKYIIEMFHNNGYVKIDDYANKLNCSFSDIPHDIRVVMSCGKPVTMIADNSGFFGF